MQTACENPILLLGCARVCRGACGSNKAKMGDLDLAAGTGASFETRAGGHPHDLPPASVPLKKLFCAGGRPFKLYTASGLCRLPLDAGGIVCK